tara:strand:- start:3 stop:212 length:210 start_codon:yes stop_codon:yes gene_type:complete
MTVAKAKEEWNNFMSRWNYMSMGYIKFFFKSLIELLISAMGLTARKNHYTHARGGNGGFLLEGCLTVKN